MGLKRPTSKKTSKADTATNNIASEPRQAPAEDAETPDITLPSLAQDYLHNKDEVMELLLTLTKALKEEREARRGLEKQLADMQTQLERVQETARQQALYLPDTIRWNLGRDMEDMFFNREGDFADAGIYEEVGDLETRLCALEEMLKDKKREHPDQMENDETLVEEEGGPRRVPDRVEVDLISDPIDIDMADQIEMPV